MIIGIIGGGQLGMMLAQSAIELNHTVYSYDISRNCPIKKYSKVHYVGKFNDYNRLLEFCMKCDVITYEFENIDYDVLKQLSDDFLIYPNVNALKYSQNRLLEKDLANELKILTCDYAQVSDLKMIDFNQKSIIKTVCDGYDGKGQALVSKSNLELITSLLKVPCIVESFIDYDCEVSLVVNRDMYNNIYHFPVTRNYHNKGILQRSVVPANIDSEVLNKVIDYSKRLVEHLDIIGTLAVEFFVKDSEVYFNEMAPRPHNSFHHTIESCDVSQFTQHIKCITNCKITSPVLLHDAIMVNIIGTDVVSDDGGVIHMYGKSEVRDGRKMGHITYIGGNNE